MKTLRLFALLAVLCVPVVAGDIQGPPKCSENCPAAQETTETPMLSTTLADRVVLTLRIILGF